MYVPSNSVAPTPSYAPVVAPNPPPVVEIAGASRQLQSAITGLGAALVPNPANARQNPANISTRTNTPALSTASEATEGEASSETATTSTTPHTAAPRSTPPSPLLQPRPSYLAAQVIAQAPELPLEEVALFFAPVAGNAQSQRESQRHQNQLRDTRITLGLESPNSDAIRIRQDNGPLQPRSAEISRGSAYAPPLKLRTEVSAEPIERLHKPVRRGSLVHAYGESAYDSANLRNAHLASPPEVDTTL